MKSVEAQGYSKDKALEATGLDIELDRFKNATLAWKKAGSPMNTKQLNAFMTAYIKEKKAVGAYIVVEAASDDTRLRPYSVINEVTKGKRKSTTTYQIKEAELSVKYHTETRLVVDKVTGEEKSVEVQTPYIKETVEVEVKTKDPETGEVTITTALKEVDVPQVKVISVGAVAARAGKKDLALKLMKELIETNRTDYVVEIVKEITAGQRYAGYGQYTPSKSAKLGKFVFFIAE
ncbi:MAG: hypothetical protein ACOH2V_00945 [Candidatus Saccharimonadaceae bacterium]